MATMTLVVAGLNGTANWIFPGSNGHFPRPVLNHLFCQKSNDEFELGQRKIKMAIRTDSQYYQFTHGTKPRGAGNWTFHDNEGWEFRDHGNFVVVSKRAQRAYAIHRQATYGVIHVAS